MRPTRGAAVPVERMVAQRTSPDAQEEDPPRRASGVNLFTTHTTLIGAIVVGLFVLMKTYSVAKYSLTTASALLTTAPLTVILGTITSYEYGIWPLLSLASLGVATSWLRHRESVVAGVALLGLSLVAALLSPARYLFAGAVAWVVVVALHSAVGSWLRQRTRGDPAALERVEDLYPSRAATLAGGFVSVAFVLLVITLPNAWIPAEVITYRSAGNANVVVGHVISHDGVWMTILRGGDRGLMRIDSEQVGGRRVCHLGGAQPQSMPPLILTLRGEKYSSPNVGCRKLVRAMPGIGINDVVPGSFPEGWGLQDR